MKITILKMEKWVKTNQIIFPENLYPQSSSDMGL